MDPEQTARYKQEYYGAETTGLTKCRADGSALTVTVNVETELSTETLGGDDSLHELLNQHGGLVLARSGSHPPWPARVRETCIWSEWPKSTGLMICVCVSVCVSVVVCADV